MAAGITHYTAAFLDVPVGAMRNLHAAIRQGEELRCDAMLGYYGVVVTMMGVESLRKRQYLKWDPQRERAVRA